MEVSELSALAPKHTILAGYGKRSARFGDPNNRRRRNTMTFWVPSPTILTISRSVGRDRKGGRQDRQV